MVHGPRELVRAPGCPGNWNRNSIEGIWPGNRSVTRDLGGVSWTAVPPTQLRGGGCDGLSFPSLLSLVLKPFHLAARETLLIKHLLGGRQRGKDREEVVSSPRDSTLDGDHGLYRKESSICLLRGLWARLPSL